jgi:hypothetical protein
VQECVAKSSTCRSNVASLARDPSTWTFRTGRIPPSAGGQQHVAGSTVPLTAINSPQNVMLHGRVMSGTITLDPSSYGVASQALRGLPVNNVTVVGHEVAHALQFVGSSSFGLGLSNVPRGVNAEVYPIHVENLIRHELGLGWRPFP